jgi:hypothetical protein
MVYEGGAFFKLGHDGGCECVHDECMIQSWFKTSLNTLYTSICVSEVTKKHL